MDERGSDERGAGGGVAIRTYVEQVQQHRGDFIEACIWASLMHACTPQTHKHGCRETERQTDRQANRQKVVVGVRSFSSLSHLRRRRRDTHREHGNASRRGSVTLGSGARDTKLLLRQRGEEGGGGTGLELRSESRVAGTNSKSLEKGPRY